MAKNTILTDRQTKFDFLRSILIILVVLGHSTYYTEITHFGQVDYLALMNQAEISDSVFHGVVKIITSWIYTFHMPVFMSLSGALYAIKQQNIKQKKIRSYIYGRFCRLLIPFIVVWLCWNMPIKYLTGYYNGVSIIDVFTQMLFPAYVYLWYLLSLFLVYCIVVFIDRYKEKLKTLIVLICWIIGLYFYRKFSSYAILGNPLYYLLWFYVGMHIEKIINSYSLLKNRAFIIILFILDIILFAFTIVSSQHIVNAGLNYMVFPILMTVILYSFINLTKLRNSKLINFISSYGMGIYLYAEPLNYLILFLFYKELGIESFGNEMCSLLLWSLRVFLTPLIAIGITYFMKRNNVRYLY